MLRTIFAITSSILYTTAFGVNPSLSVIAKAHPSRPNTYPKTVEALLSCKVSPTHR